MKLADHAWVSGESVPRSQVLIMSDQHNPFDHSGLLGLGGSAGIHPDPRPWCMVSSWRTWPKTNYLDVLPAMPHTGIFTSPAIIGGDSANP